MARKVGTSALPHSTTNATAFIYWRHGESALPKQYSFFSNNGAMPYIYSVGVATDTARCLADSLANPTSAAPFYRFGAQTMDAI